MKDFQTLLKTIGEIGYVEEAVLALAYVNGIPGCRPSEIIVFETGEFGQVMSLDKNRVEVLLFSSSSVRVGTRAARTNEFVRIPVGQELLGQVIDPLGFPLDRNKKLAHPATAYPVEIIPPGIKARKRISRPCETGVTLVDLTIPLGKGQRELVIGDRKTGKTSFLLQSMLTQSQQGSICIYAGIGKKRVDLKKVEEFFLQKKIIQNCIIVGASSQDAAGLIYLAPYTAMTIAEYFRDQGRDVLVVLDDLLTHAKFYREISLLGKKFPGRNSYPGDIFYIHARLLERAGNFQTQKGEASITCLPVIETAQGDIAGYMQTNIISITDGHIFFDNDLFLNGRRPAVNPFLSVTRVGRQTQTVTHREINRELLSFLTLYEKLQRYIHFGAELSETIKYTLSTGERILAFFGQTSHDILPVHLQIFLFNLLWIGVWQFKGVDIMLTDMKRIIEVYNRDELFRKKVHEMIDQSRSFNGLLGDLRKKQQEFLQQAGLAVHVQTPMGTGVPIQPTQPISVQQPTVPAQRPPSP